MRFLISGCIQAQGFGLEPEPVRLVVEAASMERACKFCSGNLPEPSAGASASCYDFWGLRSAFRGGQSLITFAHM